MRTLRITRDGQDAPRLESLPLPFLSPGPSATARDRELAPPVSTTDAVRDVRATTAPAGPLTVFAGGNARRLFVVLAGSLQVVVPEMRARLDPGDVLFLDVAEPISAPVHLHAATPCSYLEIEVEPAWLPIGTVPPGLDEGRRSPSAAPRLLRMASDGQAAHLTPFDDLLMAPPARAQEVTALSFVCLSPSMRSDWHTEPNVSLLVVLAGGFEVGVGGEGGRRTLRAGDVCLVEDFDGQGHTSASDGETRFMVLTLPRNHRWARSTTTNGAAR